MKFTVAAVLAATAGASASASGNVTYVTETVDAYTTYCPAATQLTHGSKTYTVTEAGTITITDCPCTITRPVVVTPVVSCTTCGVFQNSTAVVPVVTPANPTPVVPTVLPTGSLKPTAPSSVPTAGAGKAAALSGAGLAGVVGIAAFIL